MTVHLVEASCPTELSNIAYRMQLAAGYRNRTIIRLDGSIHTRVIGLAAENVSFHFGAIERDENGLPLYGEKKKRK